MGIAAAIAGNPGNKFFMLANKSVLEDILEAILEVENSNGFNSKGLDKAMAPAAAMAAIN